MSTQAQTTTAKTPPKGAATPPRKSLVFADGNRSLLETVGHLLDPAEYELRAARGGLEALCMVAERRPDFLFVDKACAGLDGFQLCALLKTREEYGALRVVLLADGMDLNEQVKAEALGALGVLRKPFGRRELLAILEGEHP